MQFRLRFTQEAVANLEALERDKSLMKRLKAVRKALGLLETNPRHSSLNTHKFSSLQGPRGEEVFEAYAESRTIFNRIRGRLSYFTMSVLDYNVSRRLNFGLDGQ